MAILWLLGQTDVCLILMREGQRMEVEGRGLVCIGLCELSDESFPEVLAVEEGEFFRFGPPDCMPELRGIVTGYFATF